PRPRADRGLATFARCTGEATGTPAPTGADGPTLETVEGWRRAAAGLGRVAMATAGSVAVGDAVAEAIARSAAWPLAAQVPDAAPAVAEIRVYDATGDVAAAGGARVSLAASTLRAE